MPLVLSMKKGADFYVGDQQIVVGEVHGMTCFDLVVEGRQVEITDQQSTEVLKDVFVSAGDRPQRGIARVAIEAPEDVPILRGDKYRSKQQEPLS